VRVTPSLDTLYSVIICARPLVQTDPAVVYNGANHIVVWSDMRFTGSHYWIVSSCIDTSGAVLDTGFCIGAQELRNECRPDIAFDGDRCFVVWYNYDEPFGVHGRFVNENGQPEDEIIKVVTTLASYNVNPSITFAGGNYLVVWADKRPGFSDLDISGQFVSPQGELIGAPLLIATGSNNQLYPEVAYDGSVALVIWREATSAIFGQRVYPNGGLCGSNFRISDTLPYYRFNSGLDMSPTNYLVVWSETRVGETDIYGNVDPMTHVEESAVPVRDWRGATILSGRSAIPYAEGYRIYDVCGRDVTGQPVSCGIYFVEARDRIVQKIVRIR